MIGEGNHKRSKLQLGGPVELLSQTITTGDYSMTRQEELRAAKLQQWSEFEYMSTRHTWRCSNIGFRIKLLTGPSSS